MAQPRTWIAMLGTAALVVTGCGATGTASTSGSAITPTSNGSSVRSPIRTTAQVSLSTTSRTRQTPDRSSEPRSADSTGSSESSDAGGPIPSCAYPVPAPTSGQAEETPAPDTCQFTGASPGCPSVVSAVVQDGTTRQVEPSDLYKHQRILGGFGRWGGRLGGSMCFTEFADQSVQMTNGDQAILVLHNDNDIVHADRTELARSAGVRGVVSAGVADVTVQDPARPRGVEVELMTLGNGTGSAPLPAGAQAVQVFVVPVSSGPATVTAYDSSGAEMGTVTVS